MAKTKKVDVHSSSELSVAPFNPRSERQAEAFKQAQQAQVTIISGPAGSGKSHIAVAVALDEIRRDANKRMILSRPVTPYGEDLGFQPGDVREKMGPWLGPIQDVLSGMAFKDKVQEIMNAAVIIPIAYVQGRNFTNCTAILDEGQNCTYAQLEMFVTRLAHNGKIIITGCPEQSANDCGEEFKLFIEALRPVPGVAIVEFSSQDIVRHPLLPALVEAMRANCPVNPTPPRRRKR